jgi:hypothetical protein
MYFPIFRPDGIPPQTYRHTFTQGILRDGHPVILLLLALSFLQGQYSLQDGCQVIPLLLE